MKLKDCRENYNYFSGKTSDIVRQLGFAGIALIWIFKNDTDGQQLVPAELVPPATLIVVALIFDLLHYISGTAVWGIYNRMQEKARITQEQEFLAPLKINWPTNFFFWGKTVIMVVAYFQLLRFLANRLL